MNKILTIIAIVLLLFTIAVLVVFCIKGEEPTTLVSCVFAACTGELSVMGWIKTVKEKNKNDSNDIGNDIDNESNGGS